MGDLFAALSVERERQIVAPGAVWLRHWMPPDVQRGLVNQCRAFMDAPAGGYVPTVRGGGQMRVRMTCLGRHWNARTYTYEATRSDYDGAPVEPLPEPWAALAIALARDAGFAFAPDVCLINWYGAGGRMGLHQDKDESPASLAAGHPVVSVSLGDSARFQFGGRRRRDPVETVVLESGDVFVFGGEARLCYHGVSKVVAGSAPPSLAVEGRFNLTFRQF